MMLVFVHKYFKLPSFCSGRTVFPDEIFPWHYSHYSLDFGLMILNFSAVSSPRFPVLSSPSFPDKVKNINNSVAVHVKSTINSFYERHIFRTFCRLPPNLWQMTRNVPWQPSIPWEIQVVEVFQAVRVCDVDVLTTASRTLWTVTVMSVDDASQTSAVKDVLACRHAHLAAVRQSPPTRRAATWTCTSHSRLAGRRLARSTYDQQIVSSTPGRVAIKWLLLGWVTVCGQVNHLGI